VTTAHNKKFTPAHKQRRTAQQHERYRLEEVTALTGCLTGLDSLAVQVANHCEFHVENLAFDLASSRLAVEFWADHPVAHDVVAILTELVAEHQRHCDALTACADRLQTFLHTAGPLAHVHLHPAEPYRQRVEARLYPPTPPLS
jgi:hypothetical protein